MWRIPQTVSLVKDGNNKDRRGFSVFIIKMKVTAVLLLHQVEAECPVPEC